MIDQNKENNRAKRRRQFVHNGARLPRQIEHYSPSPKQQVALDNRWSVDTNDVLNKLLNKHVWITLVLFGLS